ncbi:hypothetical protein PM10SUCC1_32370 [Propionigenium maris DSM 9537]|uniref:Uncharacterized protein n=1 Tax=Propionigenium maris DSM 9537 TaxID=1123000 RepID=A0A9W6LPG5_9FUSO|nr:hypothetical protein [Propionigenium maris]GLI57723.1 hypothetical protein PM10SUCC1_32370 [Propionigenium maris DSM 9537]
MSRFSNTQSIDKTKIMAGDDHSKVLILDIGKDIPYTEFKDPQELIEGDTPLLAVTDEAYKVAVAMHAQIPTPKIKAVYGEDKATSTNTTAEEIFLNLYEQGKDNFSAVTNAFYGVDDIKSACKVVAIKPITAVIQLDKGTSLTAAKTLRQEINLKKVLLVMTDKDDHLAGRICGGIYPFFPGSQNTNGMVLQGAQIAGYTTTEVNEMEALGIVTYAVGSRSGGIDYGACTQSKGTDGTWHDIAIGEQWLIKENNRRTNNEIMSNKSIGYDDDGTSIFTSVVQTLATEAVIGGFFLGNKDKTPKDFKMGITPVDDIPKDTLGQRVYKQKASVRVLNKIHKVETEFELLN